MPVDFDVLVSKIRMKPAAPKPVTKKDLLDRFCFRDGKLYDSGESHPCGLCPGVSGHSYVMPSDKRLGIMKYRACNCPVGCGTSTTRAIHEKFFKLAEALPKDQQNMEEAEADIKAVIRQIQKEKGLPDTDPEKIIQAFLKDPRHFAE